MGEMIENFKILKEIDKTERSSRREQAPAILKNHDIFFESKNNGAHFIVEGKNCLIDFWPGTGKWISRKGKRGFGLVELIKFIKE